MVPNTIGDAGGSAPLRVVQWATGVVGRHAIAAVARRPDLELVGALVYDDAKAGRDVGAIAGVGDLGVIATTDRAGIAAIDADCVLYTAQGETNPTGTLDDICLLLGTGKNVVSTALTGLINPASLGPAIVDRLEAACTRGGSSFHATGVQPGWVAEVLPLTMSGLFARIDSLTVREILDFGAHDSPGTLIETMGFGLAPDASVPLADPVAAGSIFRASLMLVARGLEATIDDFTYAREVAVAATPFEVKVGRIDAGTVSAQRFSCTAVIRGRPAFTIEHVIRLRDDQAPDWPRGNGWQVTVEGAPSMALDVRIGTHGEDEADQGCLATAMHAVHAIRPVCEAAPGIRTFLDLPTILGRGTLIA
jgi:2,4-diaminopentanoate dehydrogenase